MQHAREKCKQGFDHKTCWKTIRGSMDRQEDLNATWKNRV
jgi:hypothetical protein